MFRIYALNFLLISFYLIAVKSATNYCAANLCPKGRPHIACGNNGNFVASCPNNARIVSLKPYKKLILKLHNSKRNLIARGGMKRYKAAKRMALMEWDNELAKVAAFNVKQCTMKHDKCRNTSKFRKAGQNLAMMAYSGSEKKKSDKEIIINRVNAWWKEHKNCKMSIIKKYPKNYSGPAIGHFTVFVAEKNIRVGCAAARFKEGKLNYFLIGCNYATTNIVGKPIYRSGSTASGCITGRDSRFKGLCSKKEVYNVN